MRASEQVRPGRVDSIWKICGWMCGAAAVWCAIQPGGLLPGSWNGWPSLLWIPLLIMGGVRAGSAGIALLTAWIGFTVAWSVSLAWVRHVSVAGWVPLAAYSAMYPALFAACIRWTSRRMPALPLSMLAGVFGVTLEYVRGEVLFDAWPFHLAAHPFQGDTIASLASVGGVWACSFAVYTIGGSLAALCCGCVRRWFLREGLLPAALILSGMSLSWWGGGQPVDGRPLRVLAVQTNVPQDNKMAWSPMRQQDDVDAALEQTALGMTEGGVDLVVWPETMVPGYGFEPATWSMLERAGEIGQQLTRWPKRVAAAALESGTPWLVGTSSWVDVAVKDGMLVPAARFNSAVLIDDSGMQRADKVFLTPFGETMPYVRAWPWLEQKLLDFGAEGMQFDLDAADAPVRLLIEPPGGAAWSVAVPICFEDAVPSVVRSLCVVRGETVADIIVNISNDGWFGSDDAGRASHAAAASFRAIELGRPLLRVANTGISGVVLPSGLAIDTLPPREAATAVVELPRCRGTTMYARFGNWLPRLSVVIAVWLLIVAWRRSRPGG